MASSRLKEEDQDIGVLLSSESSSNVDVMTWIVSNEIFNFPSHAENTLQVMESHSQCQQPADVTLIVGNKRIAAHRLILSASSDYFATMFTSSMRESVQSEIKMMEIDEDALLAIIEYCYTGCIEPREENVEILIATACQLQVNPVVAACTQFLIKKLDSSNCLGIKKFAHIQGCDTLASAANIYALENFIEVASYQEFLLLSTDEVAEFLKSEDVNVPSEETMFNILTTWLEHDLENRKRHASTLLSYVRLPLLTPGFITDHIQSNKLFRDHKAVQDLISEALMYHLSPEGTESSLQSGRTKPRMSTMNVLLVLGRYGKRDSSLSIDAFIQRTNVWKNLMNVTPRVRTCGAVFFENELFVVREYVKPVAISNVSSFDFSSGLWKERPPTKSRRSGAVVAVLEGFLYAIGGFNSWAILNTVERWNPASGEWCNVSRMLMSRAYAGVAVVNNKLYVLGGFTDSDNATAKSSVECYDPRKDEWTYCSPMSTARKRFGVGVLNGYIYAMGGRGTTYSNLSSVERYDPKADIWTSVAPMSVGKYDFGVGILDDQLFVVGGTGDEGLLTLVEAYDSALDKWQNFAPLKVGRTGPCVVVNRSICKI